MKLMNHKGFTSLSTVICSLIILGLLSGGYYFYAINRQSNNIDEIQLNPTNSAQAMPSSVYKIDTLGVSLKIPGGFKVEDRSSKVEENPDEQIINLAIFDEKDNKNAIFLVSSTPNFKWPIEEGPPTEIRKKINNLNDLQSEIHNKYNNEVERVRELSKVNGKHPGYHFYYPFCIYGCAVTENYIFLISKDKFTNIILRTHLSGRELEEGPYSDSEVQKIIEDSKKEDTVENKKAKLLKTVYDSIQPY